MTKSKASAELTRRAHQLLQLLVLEYIRTGLPVGSKRLASLHREGISPATIRAIMARLEQAGFLNQPHTSAGRVPTTKGFQFYIDGLERTPDLPNRQVARIREMLEQETDPGDLMIQTSQILSRLSNNLGFVLAPPQSVSVLKRIEFVKISSRRILAILVTRAGLVQSQSDRDRPPPEPGGSGPRRALPPKPIRGADPVPDPSRAPEDRVPHRGGPAVPETRPSAWGRPVWSGRGETPGVIRKSTSAGPRGCCGSRN